MCAHEEGATEASYRQFEAWFDKFWRGSDEDCPNLVPLTGDWQEYARYESTRATAWEAWKASRLTQAVRF